MNTALGSLFGTPEHEPFEFDHGSPAMILIHGFPGTPSETRPAGERLHAAGLSTYGPLLPGFGRELDRLFDTGAGDWIGAVVDCVRSLRARGREVFLFGYSFGGAVALHVAAAEPVAGVVLAAPFWRIGGARERWIWRLTRWLFPTFQPFKNLDFSNPQIRDGLDKMLPGIDILQPQVQDSLRKVRVPASFVEEVVQLGAGALAAASKLQVPVLIFQGREDEVILPKYTQELADAFPQAPGYVETADGHDLIAADAPAFETVVDETLAFIRKHAGSPGA